MEGIARQLYGQLRAFDEQQVGVGVGGVVGVEGVGVGEQRGAQTQQPQLQVVQRPVDIIFGEQFSRDGLGLAVMNRLEKAAAGKIISEECPDF